MQRVLGTASVSAPHKVAAIEALVPLGGMACYALLGGEFRPSDAGTLTLSVAYSDANGVTIASLAGRFDEVRVGLPREYATAVLNGPRSDALLPSGTVEIACAAHGEVGSSPAFFALVSALLVRMLCGETPSDEEIGAHLTL